MSSTLDHLIRNAKSIGIVSHDAGGANILNALVKDYKEISFHLLAKGPALKIFDSKNIKLSNNEVEFFANIDFVIFGTGATSYEKKLLRRAKEIGLNSSAILDHFVNYRNRFVYDEIISLPDYCFVCDTYSLHVAKKELAPYESIHLCDNYLARRMRWEIENFKSDEEKSILYVLENVDENWDNELLAWQVAFNNFYENFYKKSNFKKIIVRPHPMDGPSVYKTLEAYKEVVFDYSPSPVASLSKVSTVVGVESYLLYLAHHCGLIVYTSLPPYVRSPRLPAYIYKEFG